MEKILLIGLGPHARHYHFPLVSMLSEDHDINIEAIVDLESQRESVCEYATSKGFDINKIYYVDDKFRDNETVSIETKNLLDEIVRKHSITHIIISTEPKAHKAYALWAADKDLSVLIDKPVTASKLEVTDTNSAFRILNDYNEIVRKTKLNKTKVAILSIRRYLPVIQDAVTYLSEFINEYKVPITHIAIRHGEGMWNMPDEFFYRENHPYKYGYGLLLHSGYHFVDLFMLFLRLNDVLENKKIDDIEYSLLFTTPGDVAYAIEKEDYSRFFGHSFDEYFTQDKIEAQKDMGELDFQALINAKTGDNTLTTGVLDLLQTSYCTRYRHILPKDTYKDNGRTTHEYISIEVGHLLNIIIERTELGRLTKDEDKYDNGKSYELKIYRNSNLVGGVPYESKTYKSHIEFYLGNKIYCLNSANGARLAGIYDWLYGQNNISLLESHEETIILLTNLYHSMFTARRDKKRMVLGDYKRRQLK